MWKSIVWTTKSWYAILMKNGVNIDPGRRQFLKQLGVLALAATFWSACKQTARRWVVRFSGAPATLGHRLWVKDFPAVTREERVRFLIIGGGISGLTTAMALDKKGIQDFLLLDMDDQPGGNSRSGSNEHTAFPLGAHYLPIPNRDDEALIQFLRYHGIVEKLDEQGNPVYHERALCAAPQARLYIREKWQEGLIPQYGVSAENQAQIRAFFHKMEDFKARRGADGKYLFDIPLRKCSDDPSFRELDQLSMAEWMQQQGFSAPELLEHVRYCCLDDYGIGLERVSAWAGIHYFAARKSHQDNVLTWPEGNGYLANLLAGHLKGRGRTQHLAYEVIPGASEVEVKVFDAAKNESVLIRAEKVVLATPQYVNKHLLPNTNTRAEAFHYAPWLVATLVLREMPAGSGTPLCWDNVMHGAKGLGYINAQHQSHALQHAKQVITYYCAFDGPDALALRRELYTRDEAHWQEFVLSDLRQAHPNIGEWLESMTIQRWGHGMISPVKGFLSGPALRGARESAHPRIILAHTDLAGMSLFEEAFHQGISAADRCHDLN
ncbi:MAG TPA: FAD-dependent oxidoreductase [Saprospiraceae bacterium]|nr:FAD-dependent oxidoreductase [Saprospiraceae bacterium]